MALIFTFCPALGLLGAAISGCSAPAGAVRIFYKPISLLKQITVIIFAQGSLLAAHWIRL
jgi:hypothetical protein